MRSLFLFCYQRAYTVIGLVLLWTAFSIWQSTSLQVSVTSEKLIPPNSSLRTEYQAIKAQFGSDQIALIYAKDSELFDYKRLTLLKELSTELGKLPEVQRIESLFTVNNISGSSGWISTSPLLDSIPNDPQKLHEKQQEAINNPLMRRNIISSDGCSTLLTLYLNQPDIEDPQFERTLYNKIESLITNYQAAFEQLYQVGSPALHVKMADYIGRDQKVLLPLASIILVVLIGLMMRDLHGAFIPIINAAISTAWTLGFMAAWGIPINMLNAIVPALILIVGATEDVHIFNEFRQSQSKGLLGSDCMQYTADNLGLTLLLTGVTTFLGFAATGINAITLMQEFGWTAAFGMLSRFLVSMTFLPAYLKIFGSKSQNVGEKPAPQHTPMSEKVSQLLMDAFVQRPYSVIAFFSLTALLCLFATNKITVSNDLIGFLKEDSSIVQKLNTVSNQLSGTKVIYVTLKGNAGDYRLANNLKQLEAVTHWLRASEHTDTVISIADHLALVNQSLFGGDQEHLHVPTTDKLAAQYLLFFHRSDLKPYVSGDYASANIVIRCNIHDSAQLNRFVDELREKFDSGDLGLLSYSISGKSLMVAAAVDEIIMGQVISLSTMIALLFIIVAILFLSGRAATMAVLSNLFPIVVVFGIMGITGIPLNVGTCMVAAITMGIAVDDTLHLMVRYNKNLKITKNELPAIHSTIKAELFPVLTTSLGLAGGFIVLSFSSFVPVVQFGLLSAIVILMALLADLILTPALLSTIRLITLWDVLEFRLREALIKTSPMFTGMTKWQAKKLILLADMQVYPQGKIVIHEGEIGDSMYVIVDGNMEVSRNIDGNKVVLTQVGAGDVFGEIALVSHIKRTANVTATRDTKALVLNWESLEKLQRSSPFLSSKLFLNLSKILGMRIEDSNRQIEEHSRNPFSSPQS